MKKSIILLAILLSAVFTWAQTVTVNKAAGWFEAAYAEWQPVTGASSYNVYYTGAGLTNQKIDNNLIRSYGTHFRADVIGLKAGSYTLKIAPVISGVEAAGTTTSALIVVAHDRSGFAFSGGMVPGAYNADGTPKTGALILYVSKANMDTISLTVTGANANPCVGIQTILTGFAKGKDTRPLIVRILGQLSVPVSAAAGTISDGDILLSNNNNTSSYITLEGVGEDATANGWGVRVKNASNIEVRNLGIMNVRSTALDDIGLQQSNDHIWIHHNDHFYGMAGSAADQFKGDGAMDVKLSTYVTIAYEHFWDNGKCSLLGLSENTTTGLYITYHHNWFDHSDSRHPRVRFYSAHVYNNFYDGNSKYGVGSTMGSSVFVEGNYFRHCKHPMMTSMQGTDVFNTSTLKDDAANMGSFSSEDGGTIKSYNNTIIDGTRFVPYGSTDTTFTNHVDTKVDFDAYVASTQAEKVPATVTSFQAGNKYNNFDTDPTVMYTYTPDSPDNAMTKVMAYSGRMNGGDFKWTFINSVDDTSAALNAGLKAAVLNYTSSLVSIQGIGTVTSSSSSSSVKLSSSSVIASSSSVKASSSSATTTSSSVTATMSSISIATSSSSVKLSSSSVSVVSSSAVATALLQNGQSIVPVMFDSKSKTLSVSAGYEMRMVQIYAPSGELTMRTTSGGNTLPLNGLRAGVYLFRVFTNRGVTQLSVFIQ